jgi:hypothetical protein
MDDDETVDEIDLVELTVSDLRRLVGRVEYLERLAEKRDSRANGAEVTQ